MIAQLKKQLQEATTKGGDERLKSELQIVPTSEVAAQKEIALLKRQKGGATVAPDVKSGDDADEIRRLREELEVLALDFCFGTRFTRMHALQICKY
eukprot:g17715.t1